MKIRILAFLALALAVIVPPSWAATNAVCTPGDGFIGCQFVQGTTNVTGTFDFSATGDGIISFQFDSILASFELDVSAVEDAPVSFSGTDFPAGTVCIRYNGTNGNGGHCVRYNVTGTPFPVKGVNFSGLITVLLNYSSFPLAGIPAFGHAPGDTIGAAFSEDILTFYVDPNASNCTNSCGGDPGMGGKIPGISSFEAFKKPFAPPVPTNGYTVCNVPPTSSGLTASFQNSNSNNPIVEVSFVLAASGSNCTGGPFLRDKTATLSVGIKDLTTGNVTPQPLVNGGDANKFHFNNQNGANVQDINTNGLQSGTYQVTVISTVFSPVNTFFVIP